MKYCEECHSTYPTDLTTCPKDKQPLHSLTELMHGVIIRDKYEILEKIGVGGMASVYKARHLTFNEIRAVKVVSNKLMDDEDFLRRFKTEAVITRKLHHPNAVVLDDFDTTADGRPFIVMEYVQGRSLRSWIHDLREIPMPRALNIAKQVASALGAAHQLGIVHRDIKPDNIIVLPQAGGGDLVKVFDFGIAKIRGSGGDSTSTATQPGMVIGTPQYVSPEQASGKIGDQIDGRSDLYSLGVVLYEMLTGRLPFVSDTPVGFLIHHMQTPPTPPGSLKPPKLLPESVVALLMRSLQKDRDKRFQSAQEMIAALEKPHTVAAPTAVMGSDSMQAPTRSGHAAAAAPAVTHGFQHSTSAAPAPVARLTPAAAVRTTTEGTVYGEPSETVWKGKVVASAEFDWKKYMPYAIGILVVLIALAAFGRYSAMRNSTAVAVNTADQDSQIQQAIQTAFDGSDSLSGQKITIKVSNGNVTLTGKVNKPYLSEIASDLTRDVAGVKNLQNNIEVIEIRRQQESVWTSGDKPLPAPQAAASTAQTSPQSSPDQAVQPDGQSQDYTPPSSNLPQMLQNQERQFLLRGYARLKNQQYQAAERAFRNALRIDPNSQLAQQGLRKALAGENQ